VAWKEGWFAELNITVDASPFTNGAFEMNDGFNQNSIDVGYLGIAPAMIYGINENEFTTSSADYNDARINIFSGVNYNGSALVVPRNSDISSVKDLAGKNVGFPGAGTVQYFVILMAAEAHGVEVET